MSVRALQESKRLRPVERQARSALALDIRKGCLDTLRRLPQVMTHMPDRILDGEIKDSLSGVLIREARGVEQRSIQTTPPCARGCKNEQTGKLTGDRSQTLERRMHVEKQPYGSIIGRRRVDVSCSVVACLRERPVGPSGRRWVRANEKAPGFLHRLGVPLSALDGSLDWSPRIRRIARCPAAQSTTVGAPRKGFAP